MHEVQEGKEDSDLAAIRAWRENRTDGRMIKDHLTAPQYAMYKDLKRSISRRLKREARCKPPMEKDAGQSGLTFILQRRTVLAEVRQWEWIQQNIVQTAASAQAS